MYGLHRLVISIIDFYYVEYEILHGFGFLYYSACINAKNLLYSCFAPYFLLKYHLFQ